MLRRFNTILIPIVSLVALSAGMAIAEKPARQRPSQINPTGAEDGAQLTAAQENGTRNLEALVNESTEGLQVVEHSDGSMSIDLDGRFQHVMRAHRTADGKLDMSCAVDPTGKVAKGTAARPWNPSKGRGARLNVRPLRAPLKVAPAKAPALLEVK